MIYRPSDAWSMPDNVLLLGYTKKQQAALCTEKDKQDNNKKNRDIPLTLPPLQSRKEQAAVRLVTAMNQPDHPPHDLLPQRKGDSIGRVL